MRCAEFGRGRRQLPARKLAHAHRMVSAGLPTPTRPNTWLLCRFWSMKPMKPHIESSRELQQMRLRLKVQRRKTAIVQLSLKHGPCNAEETQKLEHDRPPALKQREKENSRNHATCMFQLLGAYCIQIYRYIDISIHIFIEILGKGIGIDIARYGYEYRYRYIYIYDPTL